MEEAWELAVVSSDGNEKIQLIPKGGIVLSLSASEPDRLRDLIDTIRRMETNTSLYAAGAFAPSLVLLNQLEFLSQSASQIEKDLAAGAILMLGLSGVILILYRAFYINLKRTAIELLLTRSITHNEIQVTAFESRAWVTAIRFAFVLMPLGWLLVALIVILLLF